MTFVVDQTAESSRLSRCAHRLSWTCWPWGALRGSCG